MYRTTSQVRVPARAAEKTLQLMGLTRDTADVMHIPAASQHLSELPRSMLSSGTAAHGHQSMADVRVGQKRNQADQSIDVPVCCQSAACLARDDFVIGMWYVAVACPFRC